MELSREFVISGLKFNAVWVLLSKSYIRTEAILILVNLNSNMRGMSMKPDIFTGKLLEATPVRLKNRTRSSKQSFISLVDSRKNIYKLHSYSTRNLLSKSPMPEIFKRQYFLRSCPSIGP